LSRQNAWPLDRRGRARTPGRSGRRRPGTPRAKGGAQPPRPDRGCALARTGPDRARSVPGTCTRAARADCAGWPSLQIRRGCPARRALRSAWSSAGERCDRGSQRTQLGGRSRRVPVGGDGCNLMAMQRVWPAACWPRRSLSRRRSRSSCWAPSRFDRLRGSQRAGAFLGGAGPGAIGAIGGSATPLAAPSPSPGSTPFSPGPGFLLRPAPDPAVTWSRPHRRPSPARR
jgi:hypothetical protein